MSNANPGTGVDIFIGEDVPPVLGPFTEVARNYAQRPTPLVATDWAPDAAVGSTAMDATQARRAGVATLKTTASGASDVAAAFRNVGWITGGIGRMALPEGMTVYSLWVKTTHAPGLVGTFTIKRYSTFGGLLSTDVSPGVLVTAGSWQRVHFSLPDFPGVGYRVEVDFTLSSPTGTPVPAGAASWVTDFQLQTPVLTDFISGDLADTLENVYAWVGTPNESSSTLSQAEVLAPAQHRIPIWSSGAYSIAEDSTPVDPADTTGAFGQITTAIAYRDDVRSFRDQRLDLTDGSQGQTTGTIRGLSGGRLGVTLTADSRLAQAAVTRQAQPFVGTLGGALRYYLSLCGVTAGIVVDDPLEDVPVRLPGWRANVYDQLKKLGPARGFEVALVSNNIVFRPFRGRIAENYRNATVNWAIDATNLAQRVEGYSYGITSGTRLAYPLGGWNEDVTVYTLDAGQTQEIDIPLEASLSAVEQPTCVAFVDRHHDTSSVYSVSGNDGIAIPPAQWLAGGGSVSVEIGEDTRSLKVTMKASSETQYAPYRIAVSAGTSDYYSSLRIRGTGVFFDKELHTLPAHLDPDRAPQEIGVTVDNEFFEDAEQLHHALLWSAARYSMPRMTINVTSKGINRRGESGSQVYPTIADLDAFYPGATIDDLYAELGPTIDDWNEELFSRVRDDFENQAYGNVGGARVVYEDCWYRIRTSTISPNQIVYTAEWDNTIADVYDTGETIAEWNARWAGKTIDDVNETPLAGRPI